MRPRNAWIICLFAIGIGWAQKPTLSDVDAALKKAEADRTAAERAAIRRSVSAAGRDALERYKQEERFRAVEDGLNKAVMSNGLLVRSSPLTNAIMFG